MFHGLNAYLAGLRQKGAGDREIKLFLDALFGTMRRRAQELPSISKMLTLAQERWPAKLLRHAPAGSSDAPASAHSIERRGRITLCAIGIIALVALIVWLFGL